MNIVKSYNNKISVSNIPVDAGIIMIYDPEFFIKRGYLSEEKIESYSNLDLVHLCNFENGTYKAQYHILDSWNGPLNGDGILKIESEKIYISDPCYIMDYDSWDKFLKEFNLLEKESLPMDGCIFIDSMGGDGEYNMEIILEKFGD